MCSEQGSVAGLACAAVNGAEDPEPPSCPGKKDDDVEDVLLSIGSTTPSEDYYAAEERHLEDLARQFDVAAVAEHVTTAAKTQQTSCDANTVQEFREGPSLPTAAPSLQEDTAAKGPCVVTPIPQRSAPITIDDRAVKSETSTAVHVLSQASLAGTSVSSLFGDPVLLTPTPAPALRTHGIVPQLQNIVATVNLCCQLDLRQIALRARNAEYNPRRFAAVIMRIREPRTTALLFRSGKIVCTGARSEVQARIAARKFARITQKLGYNAKFTDFKVQNIVASCDVGFCIKLESLALNHSQFSCYEPELFPGLVYRMVQPSILLLVFVSGKVVLTGAKIREHIYKAFDNIYPILRNYQSA